MINYKELVKALEDMSFDGECEDGYIFVGGYEEDFNYIFKISELTKDKYLVKIELYTNTRFPVGDYVRTIVSNYAKVPTSNILAVGDKYRHITEKESWLLMGFDESDFEKVQALYPQRYIGGKECMCGILYRQAGNSIVVPVLQAILRELKQYF